MSEAGQLYRLQELDLELDSKEQALRQIASQLGDNQTVVRVQARLESERQRLEEFKQQQRSLEGEVDDEAAKLSGAEQELYSGKIGNPKELTNLQREVEGLKTKRGQMEDKLLEIMDKVEQATTNVAAVSKEFKVVENEWQEQQQCLSAETEKLKTMLIDLEHKKQLLSNEIDPQAMEYYRELRKQKGEAVARVEQGVCQGCRILLTTTELQRARRGRLVRCNSCGRILFFA